MLSSSLRYPTKVLVFNMPLLSLLTHARRCEDEDNQDAYALLGMSLSIRTHESIDSGGSPAVGTTIITVLDPRVMRHREDE